tara:strand:+ start:3997 stop:4374 length:378 start_codon:yes stop_codon:yes gene_type:complete
MCDKYLPENFSIKPINSEHSKAIQKRLFDLGYEWVLTGKKVNKCGSNRIDVGKNGITFNLGPHMKPELITLDDLYRLGRKSEFKGYEDDHIQITENEIFFEKGWLPKDEGICVAKNILKVYEVKR